MPKAYRCDLHVHTCLSPCADLDMYPRALVQRFIEEKLDIVAICDHNASENVPYLMRLAEDKPITILPGMEVTSSEEVHILAIFDNYKSLSRLQQIIYDHLFGKNDESLFGCQAIVNEQDEVEGFNDRLLIGATQLDLDAIIGHIHSFGGLAIASHIDRGSFSVLSQLGFINPSSPFDALEVSSNLGIKMARSKYPELSEYALIQSSDAHFTKDIGHAATVMYLEEASTTEIKLAFGKILGRYVEE
jgi:3',5'-nucleoside bisphosphate phosphatase